MQVRYNNQEEREKLLNENASLRLVEDHLNEDKTGILTFSGKPAELTVEERLKLLEDRVALLGRVIRPTTPS